MNEKMHTINASNYSNSNWAPFPTFPSHISLKKKLSYQFPFIRQLVVSDIKEKFLTLNSSKRKSKDGNNIKHSPTDKKNIYTYDVDSSIGFTSPLSPFAKTASKIKSSHGGHKGKNFIKITPGVISPASQANTTMTIIKKEVQQGSKTQSMSRESSASKIISGRDSRIEHDKKNQSQNILYKQNIPYSRTIQNFSQLLRPLPVLKKEMNHELLQKQLQKKIIKGKLCNAIGKAIILEKADLDNLIKDYKINREDTDNYHKNKHLSEYRYKHLINVQTQKNPELLANIDQCTNRFEDYCMTPDELITKNFSEEEIQILKSDPQYFRLNRDPFKSSIVTKRLSLSEVLRDEEKKFPKNLLTKLENNFKPKVSRIVDEDKKEKTEHKKENEKENIVKTIEVMKANENYKIKQIDESNPKTARNFINESPVEEPIAKIPFSTNPFSRHGYQMKLCLSSQRRKKLENESKTKLMKKKIHFQALRDLYAQKKQKEINDFYLTTKYIQNIKAVYNKYH